MVMRWLWNEEGMMQLTLCLSRPPLNSAGWGWRTCFRSHEGPWWAVMCLGHYSGEQCRVVPKFPLAPASLLSLAAHTSLPRATSAPRAPLQSLDVWTAWASLAPQSWAWETSRQPMLLRQFGRNHGLWIQGRETPLVCDVISVRRKRNFLVLFHCRQPAKLAVSWATTGGLYSLLWGAWMDSATKLTDLEQRSGWLGGLRGDRALVLKLRLHFDPREKESVSHRFTNSRRIQNIGRSHVSTARKGLPSAQPLETPLRVHDLLTPQIMRSLVQHPGAPAPQLTPKSFSPPFSPYYSTGRLKSL